MRPRGHPLSVGVLFGVLSAVTVLIVCTGAVFADTSVHCVDGRHEVSVSFYQSGTLNADIVGILFQREWIGICGEAEMVPAEPLEFPRNLAPPMTEIFVEASLPSPAENVVFRYTPYAVLEDGGTRMILDYCGGDGRSYTLASCGEAPLVRGRLGEQTEISLGQTVYPFVPCASDCWTETPDHVPADRVEELMAQAGIPLEFLGLLTLDLHGDRTWCRMLGGSRYSWSALEVAPSNSCGPVPTQTSSWGAVKSRYR